jgi:hypothetical protein
VAGYSKWMICNHMGLQVTDKYYEHYTWEGNNCQRHHYHVGCTCYTNRTIPDKLT